MSGEARNADTIFAQAIEIASPQERAAFLDNACANDPYLRREVEKLVEDYFRAGEFLEQPVAHIAGTVDHPLTEGPGCWIGPYKLLQKLGEGGMGTVWVAEQTEPVKRRVALKVIKPGLDSAQVLHRFEAERQALALMDHTHIAKVFDAGTTPEGRPYFVMELVKGAPMTKYCDELHLPIRERLELFVPVCQAIQHAHQKGIIHRDIKPSNVLVAIQDGRPVAKVIDFGVAKALHQRLTEESVYTEFGQVIGTLEYMSPEQAELSVLDIDTRADIYALGALLYELLTGSTPLDRKRLHRAAFAEMLRMIKEEEPPKPSTRLTQSKDSLAGLAAQRRTEPAKLTKTVRGELDWIVMKCLEKDRTRRYDTANSLARDVERYLHDEPVEACPPSVVYRLSKFARKYRTAMVVAAAFAVLLLAGTVISTYFAAQAARRAEEAFAEKRRADQQAEDALAEKRRADEKAEAEAQARRDADDALTKARQAHADSMLGQAQIAWRDYNQRQAGALLDEVPRDLRRWEWGYLKRLFRGRDLTLYGHTGSVWGVAFSPDGQRLATASWDGTLKVWNARTGQELVTLKGHTSGVISVAFSPDGQRLASGSQDRTVRVWDAHSGKELLTLRGHTKVVRGVAFSPDGQRLASTSFDQTVRVWDLHTGKEALNLRGHEGGIWCVAFSPDGQRLASASHDKTAKIWDAHTGRDLLTLRGHTGIVWSVAFSPDGQRLATASSDQTAKVWELDSGQELGIFKGHTGPVVSVAFSPDGQRLATGSWDQTAKIWEARTSQELLTLKGHAGFQVMSVAFSSDGQRLATSGGDDTPKIWDVRGEQDMLTLKGFPSAVSDVAFSFDGQRLATAAGVDYRENARLPVSGATVKVWDASTGQEFLALPESTGPAVSVVFSPDGRRLATGSEDGTTKLWDAHSGQELLEFKGHTDRVRTVVFSPDGRRLATASFDGTTKVWDADTGRILFSLAGKANRVAYSPNGRRLVTADWEAKTATMWDALSGQKLRTLTGHTGNVFGVAFSPDGLRLATTSGDGTARVWDAVTGQRLLILAGHSGYMDGVAYSPDGQRLATTGNRTVKVWDALSGRELLSLTGHTSFVHCVAFSPDGQRLASGSMDRTARIWDGRPVREPIALRGHGGPVNDLAFSPNGQRLATVGADQMVRIWDPGSGRLLLTLVGHTASIRTVAFSSDGRYLATGDDDHTARIWDVLTGQPLRTLSVQGDWVSALAFSPDSERLATVSGDNTSQARTMQLWDVRTGRKLHSLRGYKSRVYRLTFSPDGQRVAIVGSDGVSRVWDVQTWQEVADPEAAKFVAWVHDPALSPDGRYLARAEGEVVYLHDLKQPPNPEDLAYREALAQPDPIWQEDQAVRCERDRQWFAAAFHLSQALTARPNSPLHGRRGRALAELSRWEGGCADFARAVEEEPDQPDAWRGLALTQLLLKQPKEHRQTCARFLEHFRFPPEAVAVGLAFGPALQDPLAGVVLARLADPLLQPLLTARRLAACTVVLRPDAVAEPARLLSWTGGDPVVRGAVLCRAGRYDEAVQTLGDSHDLTALLYRALAEHGRGRDVPARAALQEAEHLLAKSSTEASPQTKASRLSWDRRAEAELLRAEVQALLRVRALGISDSSSHAQAADKN